MPSSLDLMELVGNARVNGLENIDHLLYTSRLGVTSIFCCGPRLPNA